jgi:hypothetical protein
MTAIAKMLALAFPADSVEAEILKVVAILCGIGLLVSLGMASFGIDLSPGFSERMASTFWP